MTRPVIADAGPIVALLNTRDAWHAWAKEQFRTIIPPAWTCEAVVTEAAHLLRHTRRGSDAVLDLFARDLLRADFKLQAHIREVRQLMRKYRDQPMSLADACLVRMSEQDGDARVLTLDAEGKLISMTAAARCLRVCTSPV